MNALSAAERREHILEAYDVKSTPSDGLPWTDDPRGDDKTRVHQYLLNHPAGSPIPTIVDHLFGVNSENNDAEYQREYRFVKRFVESVPIYKIDRGQQFLHISPRPAAFHLTSPKHYSNTDAVGRSGNSNQSGESTLGQSVREERARGGSASTDSPIVETTQTEIGLNKHPRDFAGDFLNSRGCTEMTRSRQKVIEQQFVNYREQIADRYNILRNINDEHPEYLLIPYRTLYNSEQRVSDNWRRYQNAWEAASNNYSRAIQITLTTDPKRYDSLQEMADATSENFNRFMSWVRRRLADRCDELGTEGHNLRDCPNCEEYGDRPDYIKVLEWTDKGRPHLHVIMFGIDWLAPQHEIASEWGKYQAAVVDVRSCRRVPAGNEAGIRLDDGNTVRWMTSGDGEGNQKNEKAHQAKYLSEQMPANESVSQLQARVDDPDDHLWKTVMFWATGKRFWSCSEDLQIDDRDEETIADLPQYVHVGAAKASDIPKHVWESSVKLMGTQTTKGKDPPD